VLESDRTAQAARAQNVKRLEAAVERLNQRIEAMYVDKLDGRISQEAYDRHAAAWRGQQLSLRRRIQDIQKADRAPLDQAIDALRLTSHACQLFEQQPPGE
jgi:site-specific DNA recombinase